MDGKLRNMTSVYLLQKDKILLLHRLGSKVVGNSYVGAAGGHFEPGEISDARACVRRERKEETGLDELALEDLTMRYVTLRLKNGEVSVNIDFQGSTIDFQVLAAPVSGDHDHQVLGGSQGSGNGNTLLLTSGKLGGHILFIAHHIDLAQGFHDLSPDGISR